MLLITCLVILSCKKEQQVVGTDELGNQLVVNENGDTIKLEEPIAEAKLGEDTSLEKTEDGTYTFRYNLKKGENYPFHLKIHNTQTLSDGKKSEKVSSTKTTEVVYHVDEVNGNQYKLTATFKSFTESFEGPNGEKLSYNTSGAQPTDKDVAQSWKVYKAITGESFNMEVDNQGKVLNVNGIDKVITKVQSKLKSDFNAEEQKFLAEMLKNSLNSQFIKMQFEETLNIFPDKGLKIGEEWSDSQNISEGPIKGTNKVTRTFKGINGKIATISVNGVQKVSGKDSQQGITMSMSSDATINGTITLDLHSGWIKKVDLTKTETNKQTYEGQGQKESMTQTSTTKTTVN